MKKPSGPRSDEPEQRLVDIVAIDRLAQIIQRYDLSEVEIEFGEVHVRLARERTAATDPLSTVPLELRRLSQRRKRPRLALARLPPRRPLIWRAP